MNAPAKKLSVIFVAPPILSLVKSSALVRAVLLSLLLPAGPALRAADTAAPVAPTMQEISPGVFQIGQIRIDQQRRTATFPGKVNMADGLIEYLLVTPDGAKHESLLVTEVQPADLHFAMLLLGAKGAGITTPAPGDAPPAQIDKEYLKRAPELKGDSILISVKWKAGEAEKTAPVEDWIINTDLKKPAPRGPWLYTGSMFIEGRFLAQAEGTFASLVTYPAALINNPRKGKDDDSVWTVSEKATPPIDTPLEIVIQLEPPAQPKPTQPK
ncbi:MAG: hypothetical protein QOE70_2152 [Chthoniobacter sp.]|nr:hypothetical protein [Chthoniobacter sp.]